MSHFTKLKAFIDMEKIGWQFLSENPCAIYLLEANQDKIRWVNLSANPAPEGIIFGETENLRIIIQYCLKIRYGDNTKDKINNFVLFIFTFYVNYLKFYVKKGAIKGAKNMASSPNEQVIITQPVNELSNFGYYPGIISDFADASKIDLLFTPLDI